MKGNHTKSIGKEPTIHIGENKVSFTPESKKSIDLEIISENFAVVVTSWDEPYDSIRKKHLRHHATHHA